MKFRIINFLIISILILTGCTAPPSTGQLTPVTAGSCPDLMKVANAFYDSNDASHLDTSLSFLTDDVIMVFWAEGINGHYMDKKVVIGKDQMGSNLNQPGLHRKSGVPNLPNFKEDHIRQAGNQLIFNLTPDRNHPDGRPYNPYVIELVFSGCKIEIIKIVERITWV